jgi:hypothetical protein
LVVGAALSSVWLLGWSGTELVHQLVDPVNARFQSLNALCQLVVRVACSSSAPSFVGRVSAFGVNTECVLNTLEAIAGSRLFQTEGIQVNDGSIRSDARFTL